jgi:hypothetical protein
VAEKPFVSVKIDAEVYRMVKTVAAWQDVTIADYLTAIVKPVVERDLAKLDREARGKQGGKPGDN